MEILEYVYILCLPLDVPSQVAVQNGGGCEEARLRQRNNQLTGLPHKHQQIKGEALTFKRHYRIYT